MKQRTKIQKLKKALSGEIKRAASNKSTGLCGKSGNQEN